MRRDKEFTLEEVKDHARRTDCWVVIDNNVYDLTSFIDSHPGGEYAILDVAGEDATEDFHGVDAHDNDKTKLKLAEFMIGSLKKPPMLTKADYIFGRYKTGTSGLLNKQSSTAPTFNAPGYSNAQTSNSYLNVPSSGTLTGIGPSRNRRQISPEELQKHNLPDDGWIAIDGLVFDVSTFMYKHPGGPKPILRYLGADCTDAFHHITGHMFPHTIQRLQECYIGDLTASSSGLNVKTSKISPALSQPAVSKVVEKDIRYPCSVESVAPISPDTAVVTIRLNTGFSIPASVGQHVSISYTPESESGQETMMRSYTPIAILEGGTLIRFIIKQYRTEKAFSRLIVSQRKALPGYTTKAPPSTSDIKRLKFMMSPPKGNFQFSQVSSGRFDKIVMFCAGTGVAPMYQITQKIISSKFRRPMSISLVSVNKTVHDVLLFGTLNDLTYCRCEKCITSRRSSNEKTLNLFNETLPGMQAPSASDILVRKMAVSGSRVCLDTNRLPNHTQLHNTFVLTRHGQDVSMDKNQMQTQPSSHEHSISSMQSFAEHLRSSTKEQSYEADIRSLSSSPVTAKSGMSMLDSFQSLKETPFKPGNQVVLGKPSTPNEWKSLVDPVLNSAEEEWVLALVCGPDEFSDSIETLLKSWDFSNSQSSGGPMNIQSRCYFRF